MEYKQVTKNTKKKTWKTPTFTFLQQTQFPKGLQKQKRRLEVIVKGDGKKKFTWHLRTQLSTSPDLIMSFGCCNCLSQYCLQQQTHPLWLVELSYYKTTSLMSRLRKIFLKVIHGRIYNKSEANLSLGFGNGLWRRETLFGMNVLPQRCHDISVDVYSWFIDFHVKHLILIKSLRDISFDGRDIHIVANLYWIKQQQFQWTI